MKKKTKTHLLDVFNVIRSRNTILHSSLSFYDNTILFLNILEQEFMQIK